MPPPTIVKTTGQVALLLLAAAVGGCVGQADAGGRHASSPTEDQMPQPTGVLLFIGDSLTDGDGVDETKNFVGRLAAWYPQATFLNQGRSGWSTASFMRNEERFVAKLPSAADIVFIQLGANDLREQGESEQTLTDASARMGWLIDMVNKHVDSPRIVLVAPANFDIDAMSPALVRAGYSAASQAWLSRIGGTWRSLAEARGLGFIDLFGVLGAGDTLDGAHPTEAGHRKLAEAIEKQMGWRRPTDATGTP